MALNESYNLETLPYYSGPLGFEICEGAVIFRLWAPSADDVVLNLYHDGLFGPGFRSEKLEKYQDGHWEVEIDGNLEGIYYDYSIK